MSFARASGPQGIGSSPRIEEIEITTRSHPLEIHEVNPLDFRTINLNNKTNLPPKKGTLLTVWTRVQLETFSVVSRLKWISKLNLLDPMLSGA